MPYSRTRARPVRAGGSSAATTRCWAPGRPRRSRDCASSSPPPGCAATSIAGPTTPPPRRTTRSCARRSRTAGAALGETIVGELGALPFEAEEAGARFVHASPVSDLRSFAPEPAEEDAELLAGVTHERLLFGHTHIQFRRTVGGVELVNPGSVGYPMDGDRRAAYALIDPSGALELRRVAYDTEAAIAGLREAFGDHAWVAQSIGRLERASLA